LAGLSAVLPVDCRIGFIGAGRLAGALAIACESTGVAVTRVASARAASAERMAALLPRCQVANAQAVADNCDLVFITTPDAAIAPTAGSLHWRPGQGVVHCSGATDVDAALACAHTQGAWIGGFHPLQTFADPQAAARSLPGCTITIEARAPQLDSWLVDLTTRLGCRVNRLPPGMRACYHAAAGYGSQFINALFAEAARLWATWGATEADAAQALLPLARGTLAAIEAVGIADGMPGPVSRGDLKTVAQHLASFDPTDAAGLAAYRLLCARTVDLVEQRGALDAATLQAVRRELA
jgi:predicted short-subunit dehydrogenase-like oxidoreductase (DUF2520 family)